MTFRIWRKTYNPFNFGNLRGKIFTFVDIPLEELVDLGMGFKGIVIKNDNKTYIFERESGGLVGNSLEQVKEDIKECGDIPLMCEQIMKSLEERRDAVEVTYEEFFTFYKY